MRRRIGAVAATLALTAIWGTGPALAGTTWRVQPTPNPPGSAMATLNSVSCPSDQTCTAVGTYTEKNGPGITLAEQRVNGTWVIQPTPSPGPSAVLEGVSCLSATDCTAFGYGAGGTLAEHWDGTSWSIQATPNPPRPRRSVELTGVSCPRSRRAPPWAMKSCGTTRRTWSRNSGTAPTGSW